MDRILSSLNANLITAREDIEERLGDGVVMTLEAPPASSPAVHNVMVANKSTNTKPELLVRRFLRNSGFPGYRLHWRIDGEDGKYICRPDIAFPGRKLSLIHI